MNSPLPSDDAHSSPRASGEVTALFSRYAQGDRSAAAKLTPLVYEELKRVAKNHIRRERADHTLQGTALVNEAFLRMNELTAVPWHDRVHFFRLASQVMRHLLIDHARAKLAQKRGGDVSITSLDQTAVNYHEQCAEHLFPAVDATSAALRIELDFIALDAALEKLRALSMRQAQVVDMRFFGGLPLDDVAEALDVSLATVKRDWTMARLFLKHEMESIARDQQDA
jgi:RNA polymerase sigma-70 factor, ECF subfamily